MTHRADRMPRALAGALVFLALLVCAVDEALAAGDSADAALAATGWPAYRGGPGLS